MKPAAADLHRYARDERARRKAAWAKAGQGLSDRAMQDDILWSNIEHRAARFADDPAALKRAPGYWTRPETDIMIATARATAIKAETSLDRSAPGNGAKVAALWHIYRWLRAPERYLPALAPGDRVAA